MMSATLTPKLPSLRRVGDQPGGGLVLASALVLVSGAAMSLAVVLRLSGGSLSLSYGLWVALSGAVGAWAGLGMAWRDLGWPGTKGILLAVRGSFVFAMTGAIAGGSLVLPIFGTMFAPFAVIVTLMAIPAAAVGLAATLALVHRRLLLWRARGAPF